MNKEKKSVAIIGCGNMGSAILRAIASSPLYSVSVYNRTKEKAIKAASGLTVQVLDNMEDAKNSDIVIISTKPQTLKAIYPSLSSLNAGLFISIAAGVKLSTLEENLKSKNCVRYMPNIASSVKSSVTAVTYDDSLAEEKKKTALSIASLFGSAFYLEENLFSAFIGISGSAIAYVYEFIHALILGGIREGINYNKAEEIVLDTLKSAIELEKATRRSAIDLETMVCSARGTTIEGVKCLKDFGFERAVIEAVSAASNKSRELEANS